MKLFLKGLFIASILNFSVSAQHFTYEKENFEVKKAATIDPNSIQEKWMVHIQNTESPKPGGTSSRSQLMKLKKELRKKYPVNRNSKKLKAATSKFTPSKGRMFQGNLATGGAPNDNDMAISNDGMLVSVINSNIYMYDTNTEELLFNSSLGDFTSELEIPGYNFDPKVLYDPIADRFVMIYISGYLADNNAFIVCFSSTGNPTDEWHSYVLNGNPLDNDTWSDYPSIAISETDFYLSFNTFFDGSENNSGYHESTLWQIDLASGYNGDEELSTSYFHGIKDGDNAIFNLCPIKGGSKAYGTEMYVLANKALAEESKQFYLLNISDSQQSGQATLNMKLADADISYYLPGEAHQSNDHRFDTNDSRVLGGFYENGQIQFVQNCMDVSSGLSGIYHGFISKPETTPTINATVISDAVMDYGFPNIAYTGRSDEDIESLITFNHSSPVDSSGCSAIYYGNDGLYSKQIILRKGDSYVNMISGTYERWGDYTGIQRKFNEPGIVWAGNSYGGSGKVNKTWISEIICKNSIRNPLTLISNEGITNNELGASTRNPFDLENYEGLTYPNPVANMMHIQFNLPEASVVSIAIYNETGQQIKELVNDKVKAGVNTLEFSMEPLPPGRYVVSVSKNNWVFYKESFIKL